MGHSVTYKQLIVFLLLIALLIHSFDRLLIISDYYLDTASYAANCVNKANQEMHCNGKCQMNIKLKQEDEKDKKNPEQRLENHSSFYLVLHQSKIISIITFYTPKQKFGSLPNPSILEQPRSIFKPPAA